MDFDVSHILIRKNRRARHLRLQIDKNGHPVLTVPFLCPQWYALKWAEKQQGWIQKHIFRPAVFVPDQNISVCGRVYTVKHHPEQKGHLINDTQIVVGGDRAFFNRRVRDVIKQQFLSSLKIRVQSAAERLGVSYGRITLRDTSSRWGSCSSGGHLSFCWRIALAPDFVIDYLVAHEVSHLRHMNHSPAFWQTVASLTPDIDRAKRWLKYHAQELRIG